MLGWTPDHLFLGISRGGVFATFPCQVRELRPAPSGVSEISRTSPQPFPFPAISAVKISPQSVTPSVAARPILIPPSSVESEQSPDQGTMFWFTRKTLSGSYLRFTSTSRS
jgi:hypothetical protein